MPSSCLGCSCTRPAGPPPGSRVLLATRVGHTADALRAVLHETGATAVERAPGLLEVGSADPAGLLSAARARLSSVEAAEVRAAVVQDEQDADLLALALTAPTLAQLGARVAHTDLLPLFADELQSFRSVYQPIVSLDDHRVIGHEALLRATGPDGPVLPGALFAAAAEAGWMHVLDRVGRTTALRGARGWLGDDLLFVNFVPTTIYRPEVCLRTTEQAAERAGLRLDQLVFEVTESEQVGDLDHLAEVFAYYRERGCRVALDDLGAGYSSLNMLVRLQPDIVKLDKDIVQRLPDPVSCAVVAAVVEITHAYGGQVLAECIETAEQAAAARDLGTDLGQGWLFGRPQERGPGSSARPAPPARQALLPPAPAGSSPGRHGDDAAVALDRFAPPPAAAPGSAAAPAPTPPGIEGLLARAVGVGSAGVSISDAGAPDLPLVYVNPAFEQVTGYTSADLLGRNCRVLQGADTDRSTLDGIRAAVAAGRDHVCVVRNYRKDGTPWWNELRLSPVRGDDGRVTHYFGFQNDVTARVEAEQRLAHLAYHDPLTGLPNRAQVARGLERELARAAREGEGLAVLFVDLDGFKAVNDQLGHEAGDLALMATALRLRGTLRAADLLGRHSGDEFLAVLTGVSGQQARSAAQRAAHAVLDSFHSPLDLSGRPVRLGASIGVALYPEHGADAATLVRAADRAMYAAKAAGRGCAVLADQAALHSGGPGCR